MIYFLTSSPCVVRTPRLNPANGFVDELGKALIHPIHALFITSAPDDAPFTDRVAADMREAFDQAGFPFRDYDILDRRTQDRAAGFVRSANLIILSGGHTPTENRFFAEIGLRDLLRDYAGVLVGISAGSMNSAETVYAQPEEEGEAISKDYQRFLPGLGLTKVMILPHYQIIKDNLLDGLRLFEDITYPDSFGRTFHALVDGSFLLGRDGREELRGEAYTIRDGVLRQISREGDIISLP